MENKFKIEFKERAVFSRKKNLEFELEIDSLNSLGEGLILWKAQIYVEKDLIKISIPQKSIIEFPTEEELKLDGRILIDKRDLIEKMRKCLDKFLKTFN
jgi:hypothetical protein